MKPIIRLKRLNKTAKPVPNFALDGQGFVDKNFPHLSEAIAARVSAEGLKLLANQQTAGTVNAPLDDSPGLPQAQPAQSSNVNWQTAQPEAATIENATLNNAVIANTPITPEASGAGKIFRFLLTLLILAALMYFFLHRR